MRIEQRIGRVHRYGQTAPWKCTTWCCARRSKSTRCYVLTSKLDMFQTVIGEIEAVLSFMEEQRTLDVRITEVILGSRFEETSRRACAKLAELIHAANDDYRTATRETTALLEGLLQ